MVKKRNSSRIFVFAIFFLMNLILTGKSYTVWAATNTSSAALNTSDIYLVKGEATALKVTGTTKKVIWTSVDKKVATVTSSGKVVAAGYGITYVKAAVSNKIYKCKVTVIDPAEITFRPSYTTVFVNGTAVSLNPVSDTYSAAAIKKAGISYKVTGNSGVKVSSTGIVTAESAGSFNITASVHGRKIQTIDMNAATYDGFTVPELLLDTNIEEFAGFTNNILPLLDDVDFTVSNSSIVVVEKSFRMDLSSDFIRCDGIYVKGIKEGTCYIKVTVSGITKELKITVGDGLEKLDPVDAIKNNDLRGYTGKALITLTAVRKLIDDNNLLSSSLSDKEKITAIQSYLNSTYSGKLIDDTYQDHISGVILTGSGICASYAETFSFLCDCIGIEEYYCIGSADNRSGTGYGAHAWNRVKIDGTWYYIDPYWNAGLNSYQYSLSETLWTDHRLVEEGYFAILMYCGIPPYSNSLE